MPSDLFAFDERTAAIDALHAATAIYTAASVVDGILDDVRWPTPGMRLLDPSCGDGSFLVRAIARLPLRVGDTAPLACVRGWEFHPGAVADARDNITQHLVERGWLESDARNTARDIVIEADFLTDGPHAGIFDVIVGNPPYLRWNSVPQFLRDIYSRRVPKYAQGDILHTFLDYCADILPSHGAMGFVCSDRVLFNETCAQLRSQLGQRLSIVGLKRLDNASSFYRPKRRVKGSLPRIHPVKVIFRTHDAADGLRITEDPISPDALTAEYPHAAGLTLGAIASVRLAPWLGGMGVFVVDADTAQRFPTEALIPVVDTDDIDPHSDALRAPTRYAIRTTRDTEPVGVIRDHLLRERHRLAERARMKRYWVPPEAITLPLDKPTLLIPRIARRLRVVPLPPGILPINHNLSVVASSASFTLERLEEVLTSASSQDWIRRCAPRLENGFYSITTTLLRRLPITEQAQIAA